jgi:predicted DCC family thiol-disulfide oxidoreductase YuxK
MPQAVAQPDTDLPLDASPDASTDRPVMLFDGNCALCHRSVRVVLRRERKPWCNFAALQSAIGRTLVLQHGLDPDDLNSMVYIERGTALIRSSAVLRIAAHLRAPYRWASVFMWVPRVIRDAAYRVVAKHRIRVFGSTDVCFMPDPAQRHRFLDLVESRADGASVESGA